MYRPAFDPPRYTPCEICEEKDAKIVFSQTEIPFKGEVCEITRYYYRCGHCNNEFTNSATEAATSAEIFTAYKKKHPGFDPRVSKLIDFVLAGIRRLRMTTPSFPEGHARSAHEMQITDIEKGLHLYDRRPEMLVPGINMNQEENYLIEQYTMRPRLTYYEVHFNDDANVVGVWARNTTRAEILAMASRIHAGESWEVKMVMNPKSGIYVPSAMCSH